MSTPSKESIRKLRDLGQSLWLDNITRALLDSGTLARYRDELAVTGLTSNPTIFLEAIGKSDSYDQALQLAGGKRQSDEQMFTGLAIDDLRRAAGLFLPAHRETGGVDGWVSMEVSPLRDGDVGRMTVQHPHADIRPIDHPRWPARILHATLTAAAFLGAALVCVCTAMALGVLAMFIFL